MNVSVPIPDDLAARLSVGGDLGRQALEALARQEHHAGRLTRPELSRLLGLTTESELDGFLEAGGVTPDRPRAEEADVRGAAARFRAFRAGKTLGLDAAALIREGRR